METTTSYVPEVLREYPIITTMVHADQLMFILGQLENVLLNNVEGDVVELGCNCGTTSLFIRRILNHYKSKKCFHVYDSFQGIPDISPYDISQTDRQFRKGQCQTTQEILIQNFCNSRLEPPIIHKGWFSEIPDYEYPEKIAFAFFDGDLYSSIMDSFSKVYHKLTNNAVICVHDYKWPVLPGVEKACNDFFADKPGYIKRAPNISVGYVIR
ncbi:MAG: TylF/MycF/NovP-related O-methyltransferase [Candidatus Auribacterota bacterium]|nr:TylF/MycF/NovP-related O-methyltransferase [Candidatus Auribacterota bacterium]